MPFYLVTIKNRFGPKYHEKEFGPCNTSPNCTDSEGAHHTYLAKAPDMQLIFASALKEGVHVTRVEEVYHIREYEAADVSVRDDADRSVTAAPGVLTEYNPAVVPGFGDIPIGDGDERIYYSDDPHHPTRVAGYLSDIRNAPYPSQLPGTGLHEALERFGNERRRSAGEVPGAAGPEQDDNQDHRVGPDRDGIIRN